MGTIEYFWTLLDTIEYCWTLSSTIEYFQVVLGTFGHLDCRAKESGGRSDSCLCAIASCSTQPQMVGRDHLGNLDNLDDLDDLEDLDYLGNLEDLDDLDDQYN